MSDFARWSSQCVWQFVWQLLSIRHIHFGSLLQNFLLHHMFGRNWSTEQRTSTWHGCRTLMGIRRLFALFSNTNNSVTQQTAPVWRILHCRTLAGTQCSATFPQLIAFTSSRTCDRRHRISFVSAPSTVLVKDRPVLRHSRCCCRRLRLQRPRKSSPVRGTPRRLWCNGRYISGGFWSTKKML